MRNKNHFASGNTPGSRNPSGSTVFVGGISGRHTAKVISAYFNKFGRVKDVKMKKKIAKDKKAFVNCGYCLVDFYDSGVAE